MYVKPPRRQLHTGFVPDNYNGTAFSEPKEEPQALDSTFQEPEQAQAPPSLPAPAESGKHEEKGLLSSLFSGFGDLRSDDLLLLVLILLMSRGGDDRHTASEVLPLLALLLFMG